MSQPQMSPEKEQELASKILHRAELAQMTRQLKLGLSNVPSTKRKQDSTTKKRSGEDAEDVDEDHKTLWKPYRLRKSLSTMIQIK